MFLYMYEESGCARWNIKWFVEFGDVKKWMGVSEWERDDWLENWALASHCMLLVDLFNNNIIYMIRLKQKQERAWYRKMRWERERERN